jgi:hypothetical protein
MQDKQRTRPCLTCGTPIPRSPFNKPPFWCPPCDEKRKARITAQFDALIGRKD